MSNFIDIKLLQNPAISATIMVEKGEGGKNADFKGNNFLADWICMFRAESLAD